MSSGQIIEATAANWKEAVLKPEFPVVIEFYTPTCPFCQQLTPIFQRLSGEYVNRMVFAMVDASKDSDLATGYGVMGGSYLKVPMRWKTNIHNCWFKNRGRTTRRV